MNFEKDYNTLIDALTEAKIKIEKVKNPQLKNLIAQILSPIDQRIGSLSVHVGKKVPGDLQRNLSVSGAPLKKILGRDITQPIEQNNQVTAKEFKEAQKEAAEDTEFEALLRRVDAALPTFSTYTNDQILDQYDDLLIRAIAKKSGLPFTETFPKRIDSKTVDQIKAAIKKQAELAKDTATKTPDENNNQ